MTIKTSLGAWCSPTRLPEPVLSSLLRSLAPGERGSRLGCPRQEGEIYMHEATRGTIQDRCDSPASHHS